MNSDFTNTSTVDRDQLVRKHLYLVDIIVNRMAMQVPAYLSREEMGSAAMTGLMDSANRFDPSRGFQFKTFAEKRMRGAILDEARKMDFAPRPLRDKHSLLTKTIADLEKKLRRSPTEKEIAAALEMPLEEYHKLLSKVGYLGCVSLHREISGQEDEGISFIDTLVDENAKTALDHLEAQDLTKEIAGLFEMLTKREKEVLSLYYYEELSQKEIAEVLDITEGRVSQLHSQALARLKSSLQNNS